MFFLIFRRIRIHNSDWRIRLEAQKHMDPTDPDSDPDPQHCFPGFWSIGFSMNPGLDPAIRVYHNSDRIAR